MSKKKSGRKDSRSGSEGSGKNSVSGKVRKFNNEEIDTVMKHVFELHRKSDKCTEFDSVMKLIVFLLVLVEIVSMIMTFNCREQFLHLHCSCLLSVIFLYGNLSTDVIFFAALRVIVGSLSGIFVHSWVLAFTTFFVSFLRRFHPVWSNICVIGLCFFNLVSSVRNPYSAACFSIALLLGQNIVDVVRVKDGDTRSISRACRQPGSYGHYCLLVLTVLVFETCLTAKMSSNHQTVATKLSMITDLALIMVGLFPTSIEEKGLYFNKHSLLFDFDEEFCGKLHMWGVSLFVVGNLFELILQDSTSIQLSVIGCIAFLCVYWKLESNTFLREKKLTVIFELVALFSVVVLSYIRHVENSHCPYTTILNYVANKDVCFTLLASEPKDFNALINAPKNVSLGLFGRLFSL